MHEAMDPTGKLSCICEHGNAARLDHEKECPYWIRSRVPLQPRAASASSPLDERLAQIQKESGDLWQQLGQKEYVKRVLEAEMGQMCQRLLQLSQEADALKKAQASAS